MEFYERLGDILSAIDTFLIDHAQHLSAETKTRLVDASSKVSPVDKIVGVIEALYADRSPIVLEICAQATEFATRHGWHGLHEGRGYGIINACRRDLDERHPNGGVWPDTSEDPPSRFQPTPSIQYTPPPSIAPTGA